MFPAERVPWPCFVLLVRLKLPFDVRHSAKDLTALAAQFKSIDGETRVVMEHTGRYYESGAKVLHEVELYVSAVNPLLIKEYGSNSLRKVKTDKADAMIAKYALDNWTELRDYTPMDTIRYDLKTLNRQFQLASKQKTATASNLIALQEQSFPGIRKLFDSPVRSDGTQKWVDFTHDFWHVDCVRSGSQNAFTECYRKWCKRNRCQFSMEKVADVYALAKSAVVPVQKTSVTKTLVQEAANQLTAISRSVETYRSEMNKLTSQLPEYPVVMEMYGVGESLGPQLMAEIGDVRRFERKQSLVAFAGIDPAPSGAGDYCPRSNKTTKRGYPYLRKTLFNIMTVHLKLAPADELVFHFLDKKRAEGKPYYLVVAHAGRTRKMPPAGIFPPGHFYLSLQDNADQPAAALVDDAGQRLLQLFPGILRHPLQLGLQIVADDLVKAASENVGLPDLAGVSFKLLKQIVHHVLRLLLIAHDGTDRRLNIRPDHVYALVQTEVFPLDLFIT